MRGQVLEIGARGAQTFSSGSLNWDIALYTAQIRHEILSMDDPNAPGTSLATNIERSLHAGVEALLAASFPLGENGSSLAPLLSLSLNHFRGDAAYGDNQLPAAPDYAFKAELLYRHSNGFYIGPTLDLVGERYADFSNRYSVDSYSVFGLRAGLASAKWRLFAEVKNLADKEYVASHGVRDSLPGGADSNVAILNPGEPLSAYAGVEWQF
jgi:iron complex outermembrane receptor protein